MTGKSHFMLIFVLSKVTLPNRIYSVSWMNTEQGHTCHVAWMNNVTPATYFTESINFVLSYGGDVTLFIHGTWLVWPHSFIVWSWCDLVSGWCDSLQCTCTVGSSDFPRSLCFMWFWFGLEILRLVYKKAFFKILIGVHLIWALTSKKSSAAPYKSWKKMSSKLGVQGIKRSRILRWFQKCEELLRSQRFFLRKTIFCKIFQVPKSSVFL